MALVLLRLKRKINEKKVKIIIEREIINSRE